MSSLLPISYGVDRYGAARFLSVEEKQQYKDEIHARDKNTCRFCGFEARKYQEILCLKEPPVKEKDQWVTACIFCHQCFYLDTVANMESGSLIWLPEISQADLHHLCRAIYVARITQGEMADTARSALDLLISRKDECAHRLGTDDPRLIATVMIDFLEDREYKQRSDKFQGVRILPMDRRVIREGDLEFNQFPQILAYWRSKDGPFGDIPPRNWPQLYKKLLAKTAA